jgi:hypothetical protein
MAQRFSVSCLSMLILRVLQRAGRLVTIAPVGFHQPPRIGIREANPVIPPTIKRIAGVV